MAKKPDILPFRIYIGDRLWQDMSPEERAAYGEKAAQRMGEVFNDYFGQHPEVYAKFKER